MDQIWFTDEQKRAKRRKIERRMQINDIVAMFLALFGVAIAFYEYELFFGELRWEVNAAGNTVSQVVETQYEEKTSNTILRMMNGAISCVLVGLVINHYVILLTLYKAKQKVDSTDNLHSAGFLFPMLLEILYVMIHTPPEFNYIITLEEHQADNEFPASGFVCILMLGRVYLIWRIFVNYSTWNNERAEEICNSCLCDGGVSFAIKAELKERPYMIIIVILVISIAVLGMALRTAERPFKDTSGQDWDYIWNGMWCIIITMTTVGFGDFYPSTHLGRIIIVIAAFWGTFLVSLIVVSLTISSEFTSAERKSYDRIKQEEAEEELLIKAANAVKHAIRLRMFLKKNPYSSERKKAGFMNKFKGAMIAYRTHKRNLVASEQDKPIEYILAKLNDKVSFGLDRIMRDCSVYNKLIDRLKTAETNQTNIDDNLDVLTDINTRIYEKLGGIKNSTNRVTEQSISPPSTTS